MIRKILVFFIGTICVFAQNDAVFLKGKVVSDSRNLEGIHVINVSVNNGVVTDESGYFSIVAKENDTIMFSAIHLKGYQKIVNKDDLAMKLVFIPMEAIVNELMEVTVTEYKNINAESLGIVPKGQKRYTPAERKLAAAETFKWYSPLLIPIGGMSVDGLINAISGRTKRLKKELSIEKKELFQEKVKSMFTYDYLLKDLKIPEDYIDGFVFFIVEDEKFMQAVLNKNKTLGAFLLAELASEYLENIKLEADEK